MPKKEVKLGNIKGPPGNPGNDAVFMEATAEADTTHLDTPTVDVELGGEPGAQTLHFSFKGLMGFKGDTGDDAVVPVATPEGVGKVKPDDSTIGIDESGTITVKELPVELLTGTIDMSNIPQGALERFVPVEDTEARLKLTKDQVQLGDVVQELDTTTMYVVVDEDHLDSEDGYKPFSAGTAAKADVADKLGTDTVGGIDTAIYLNQGVPAPVEKVKAALVSDTLSTTTVEEGTDLNTLLESNKYYSCVSSSVAESLMNTPITSPFSLRVECVDSVNGNYLQVLTTKSEIWFRAIEGTQFRKWRKIYPSEALNLDGVLPVESGGTGETSLEDASKALWSAVATDGESVPADDQYLLIGDADNPTRVSFTQLWNWAVPKIESTKTDTTEVANKLGRETVGSTTQPIYLDGGTPKVADPYPTIATADKEGLVKPDGDTIKVAEDGTISAAAEVPIATTDIAGRVKPDGRSITVDEDGTIASTNNSGPMSFEIDETDGHLYVYYEDTIGEPNVYINDEGHLIWKYGES